MVYDQRSQCTYVPSTAQEMEVLVLGQGLFAEVREALELILVDLLDNGVFHQGEHRLLAGEVLVKIVDVPFGFLWMEKRKVC